MNHSVNQPATSRVRFRVLGFCVALAAITKPLGLYLLRVLDAGQPVQDVHLAIQANGRRVLLSTNAAPLFANWLISKEGQLTQYVADGATPIHKDMQSKEFLAFPEEMVLGRSARILEVYQQMNAVARSSASVLLVGETGSGKEIFGFTTSS